MFVAMSLVLLFSDGLLMGDFGVNLALLGPGMLIILLLVDPLGPGI